MAEVAFMRFAARKIMKMMANNGIWPGVFKNSLKKLCTVLGAVLLNNELDIKSIKRTVNITIIPATEDARVNPR